MAQQMKNLIGVHEDAGSIPGLIQCVKGSSVNMSCDVSHRCGLDLAFSDLTPRLDLPYAAGVALK